MSYPRVVGETGGKNFHPRHASADVDNAVVQTVRGAFEYQGQKCSATSRLYVPASLWPRLKTQLVEETEKLAVGAPWDHGNFVGPVIHAASFKKLARVIDEARDDGELELLAGGRYDDSKGYFVHPTIYQTTNPAQSCPPPSSSGPCSSRTCTTTRPARRGGGVRGGLRPRGRHVGLRADGGRVRGRPRPARLAEERLRGAAGNFYVNCKCTGAVVGQQPFRGARASGTNDKAGSLGLLARFVSPRSIKEEFAAAAAVAYPSNDV